MDKDGELKAKAKAKVIKSVKSVGEKTTITFNREIAALAGLAPYANDSGKSSKRLKRTFVDCHLVKRMLFMCAMVAVRNNKVLKAFYEKLTKSGKLKRS